MCCCKALICAFILSGLAIAGLLTWRYGPWYNTDESNTENIDLLASTSCPGCCNGLVTNCNLRVNEVVFPVVHNAMSSYDDYFIAANNNGSLEKALVAGYRGLMLDSCLCDGGLAEYVQEGAKDFLEQIGVIDESTTNDNGEQVQLGFCHTYCDAGVRDPGRVLGNIKEFLDVNRDEVIILEFQINDNSLVPLYKAIDESGLPKYIWRPTINDSEELYSMEWPTMQSLIDANTRLLIFAHKDEMESCTTITCPEGIMYTYDHWAQTQDGLAEGCDATTSNDVNSFGFFLLNHWLNNWMDLPSEENAMQLNEYVSLEERFESCKTRTPNLVTVDFWDIGSLLSFANDRNIERGSNA